MDELKVHADDSSDEDAVSEIIDDYDLKEKYNKFLENDDIEPEIKNVDPKGFSFLVHILGVYHFYSREVNQAYYLKKKELPKSNLAADTEKIKTWLLKTVKDTIFLVFNISQQQALTNKLAKDFLQENIDLIKKKIDKWVLRHLRITFAQLHSEKFLSKTEEFIDLLKENIIKFIQEQKEKLSVGSFDAPPFLEFNIFKVATKKYVKDFFSKRKFISKKCYFAKQDDWPTYKGKDTVEHLMVKMAKEYDGRQTFDSVSINNIKDIFYALLEKECKNRYSIVEKQGDKKFSCKRDAARKKIANSTLPISFQKKNFEVFSL